MSVSPIREGIPNEVTVQLTLNEDIYYFSYIGFKGGCTRPETKADYWIAITNQRILYKTKSIEEERAFGIDRLLKEGSGIIEKDGILPLEKVSFVEVTEGKRVRGCGCRSIVYYTLRISTSGGTVNIPIPTKEKGYEFRKIYCEITQKEK